MANINDYLKWRGDLPINEQFCFNEIDSMILARFSYLLFNRIEMEEKETIESIYMKMKDFDNEEFLYNGDKELICNLGKSNRFKNMVVTDFVYTQNKEIEKQFSAITIHISDLELYVSYIGTDSTITGWKEDFNMSFMDNVPCQIAGKEYLTDIANKYPNKKIKIGGHSKGGNVAIFSAITVVKEIQDRIEKVYNYDGPGFNKKFISKYGQNEILEKIETYLPQDSIIGRILNHKEKTTIVLSFEKGIYQHDIYSWQVLYTDLITLEKNTQNSEDINGTLNNWLDTTTVEQRKIFIDTVFDLLYCTEVNTFGEFSLSLTTNLSKMLKKYNSLSKDDKKNLTQMVILFAKAYFSVIKEKGDDKISKIKESLLSNN